MQIVLSFASQCAVVRFADIFFVLEGNKSSVRQLLMLGIGCKVSPHNNFSVKTLIEPREYQHDILSIE
jgi:hypothetical protein